MNVDFFETVTVTLEATTLLFDTATVTKPGNSVALKNVTLDLRVFLIQYFLQWEDCKLLEQGQLLLTLVLQKMLRTGAD